MATFTQLGSGNWRVQVRRKNRYVAETFRRRKDGEEWALEMERNIDRNGSPKPRVVRDVRTFGDLIDLHDEDMRDVGKPPRRSKAAVMASLKAELGGVKLTALNRERLIEFGRKRAKQGAGPATLAIDMSFIRTIITHAAAVHGIEVSAEEARLARVALSHLNLVGKSKERDRRPTQDELDELIEYFETNRRQFIPMGRIVRFAVATTLRQEEICKPEWPLVDMKKRLVVIQDRKDPRNKDGNDQKVPLLNLTGYDAWEVVLQQRIVTRGYGRVFPHFHEAGFYKDTSPRDYVGRVRPRGLLGAISGISSRAELPKGAELAAFLRDHDIGKRLDLGRFVDNGRASDFHVDSLVAGAVERYLHLHGLNAPIDAKHREAVIRPLILGTILRNLDLRLVIPVTMTHFDVDHFRLSETTYITRMPKKLQLARARMSTLGSGATGMVVGAATHAFVSNGWGLEVDNIYEVSRSLNEVSSNVLDAIDSFFGALRIGTGVSTGYAQLLWVPRGCAPRAADCSARSGNRSD